MQTLKLGRWAALALTLLVLSAVVAGVGLAQRPAAAGEAAAPEMALSRAAALEAAPAAATLDYIVNLPLVIKQRPQILFSDDFESGIQAWTPFLNYWRLRPGQWYGAPGQGFNGSSAYMVNGGAGGGDGAHDVLSMVLAPGSDQWANYRFRVRVNLLGGGQVGVWFRGTYQAVPVSGQWVTGYYYIIARRSDEAMLLQLRTAQEPGDEPYPENWYHFSNPLELAAAPLGIDLEVDQWHDMKVEVVGPRIKCYLDDQLLIDYTDTVGSVFVNGTVGLYGYGNCSTGSCARIAFDDVLVEPIY